MNSSVYTKKSIEQCTEEEIESVIGLKWVKRWKSDEELRMRLVAQGCYQDDSALDSDSVFASTPSLVTLRLLLIISIARDWTITLADISTTFLHAAMSDAVFVRPPIEYYPNGPDGRSPYLWRLNKAMNGLKQSPRLWQEYYASVMKLLGFRYCKSDPNPYCHSSKQLYVLAYVDDLLIAGDSEKAQEFIEVLNKELLVQVTANLDAGTEANFLGRRLRPNDDSIDLFTPQTYMDELLALYSMKDSNCVSATGTASLKRLEGSDQALDKTEHAKYRTAVGKFNCYEWHSFVLIIHLQSKNSLVTSRDRLRRVCPD